MSTTWSTTYPGINNQSENYKSGNGGPGRSSAGITGGDWGSEWHKPKVILDIAVPLKVTKQLSNGGPSSYYDFPESWTTLNDLIEHKSTNQWKQFSFHLSNVVKAAYRWGEKQGTSLEYDARKIVYSGLRLLGMIVGKEGVKQYLKELSEDKQFQ